MSDGVDAGYRDVDGFVVVAVVDGRELGRHDSWPILTQLAHGTCIFEHCSSSTQYICLPHPPHSPSSFDVTRTNGFSPNSNKSVEQLESHAYETNNDFRRYPRVTAGPTQSAESHEIHRASRVRDSAGKWPPRHHLTLPLLFKNPTLSTWCIR